MDPRQRALVELDMLISRGRGAPLTAADCMHLTELVPLVPGRARQVVDHLSAQGDAAAVEALLQLPSHLPGLVEAIHHAVGKGVARRRIDGKSPVRLLALDFRHSRAKNFPDLVGRAALTFGPQFERFDVRGRPHYRFMVREGAGTLAGRVSAAAQELLWLHGRLARLRGSRLWINGWCLPSDGPFGAAVQVHWVRAWLGWAALQTETRQDSP